MEHTYHIINGHQQYSVRAYVASKLKHISINVSTAKANSVRCRAKSPVEHERHICLFKQNAKLTHARYSIRVHKKACRSTLAVFHATRLFLFDA